MTNNIPFYWKTSCHTCRTAKKDLENKSVPIEPIDIIKSPPSVEILRTLVAKYGIKGMIRKNSRDYKDLAVGKMNLTEDRVVKLLHAHPDLASRPIVVTATGVFLSKDPELQRHLEK
ncbi:MAG TPA: ArsC/Spx/MgsR family protein [Nitrososphaerales archaeon]|nr:ArsC/Spx/MgsR family protein [Nitrososphaerales archaeon]